MSIYTLIPEEVVPDPEDYDLRLTERDIYGSSRLGTENINQVIASITLEHININTDLTQVVGDKHYELSNLPTKFGIGNVLQVLTDRKLAQDNGVYDPITGLYSSATEDGIVDYFTADVVSQSDYYPFGMLLPGRNSSEDEYRYGFQNQEMDDEIKGEGNSVNFKYRLYDPRIGRFFAVDPLDWKYVYWSPYAFSGNQVISSKEIEGLEVDMNLNYGETEVTVTKTGSVYVITGAELEKALKLNQAAQKDTQINEKPGGVIEVVYYKTVIQSSGEYQTETTIPTYYSLVLPADEFITWGDGGSSDIDDELTGETDWIAKDLLLFAVGEVPEFGQTKEIENFPINRTEDWNSKDEKLVITLNSAEQMDKFTIKDKNGTIIYQSEEGFLGEKIIVIDNKYGNPDDWQYEVTNASDPASTSLFSVEVHNAQKK